MSETDMLIEDKITIEEGNTNEEESIIEEGNTIGQKSINEEGNTIEEESIIEEGNTIEEESIWKSWRIIAALFVIHFIQVKVWLSCIIQGS